MMPPCLPPICWPGAAPSKSALLMHELAVFPLAQAGIDRAARERPPPSPLAGPAALDGLLQPPAGLLVVEHLGAALQGDRAEDLDHGVQVLDRVQRHGL